MDVTTQSFLRFFEQKLLNTALSFLGMKIEKGQQIPD